MGISTTTQGGPVSEVQRAGFSVGMALAGTFTLFFGGSTTSAISYDAAAAAVQKNRAAGAAPLSRRSATPGGAGMVKAARRKPSGEA